MLPLSDARPDPQVPGNQSCFAQSERTRRTNNWQYQTISKHCIACLLLLCLLAVLLRLFAEEDSRARPVRITWNRTVRSLNWLERPNCVTSLALSARYLSRLHARFVHIIGEKLNRFCVANETQIRNVSQPLSRAHTTKHPPYTYT